MTWPWYHNAGQTMTYLKNSQKTRQAAAAQPVWPSLSVHVCLLFRPFLFSFCLFWYCIKAKMQTFCCIEWFVFWHWTKQIASCLLSVSFCLSLCISVCLSSCTCLCQCSFLICLVCLPCNSLQWAAGPARESLSYWFNDASAYFTGIYMSVSLNTLSTNTNTCIKNMPGYDRTARGAHTHTHRHKHCSAGTVLPGHWLHL